ncbi:hypothetical protein [Cupriavidus sp. CuC1]|uniref:hypothetical protein n=1 Tax=Cupriavidus sp. CuC1 TaxID=3373131 RepID=UPI0037D1100D
MATIHTWRVRFPDGTAVNIRTMPTRPRAARKVVRYTDGHVVALTSTGEIVSNFVHFDQDVTATQPVRYVFAVEALCRIGAITKEQRDTAFAHANEVGQRAARIAQVRKIRESLFELGLKVPISLDRALNQITDEA